MPTNLALNSSATQETATKTQTQKEAIPYKSAPTELETHGTTVGSVMLVFLLIAWVVFAVLKKKQIGTLSLAKNTKQIHVIERTRITARSNIILLQYKDRFFLMSQSGDQLALISEVDGKDK